jgi:hypothetical protein
MRAIEITNKEDLEIAIDDALAETRDQAEVADFTAISVEGCLSSSSGGMLG